MTTSSSGSKKSWPDAIRFSAALLLLLTAPAAMGQGHLNPLPAITDTSKADTTPLPPMPPAPAPAIMIDLDRNLVRLNSVEAVNALVDTVARAGFKRLIVDVKLRDGRVVFPSRVAPPIDPGFDYFGAFRQAAERHGLEVIAYASVFADGNPSTGRGLAYDRPEWQQVLNIPERGVMRQTDSPQAGQFILLNPLLPAVQRYETTAISDMIQNLKPDAILLNEIRFVSRESDLSDSTRILFDAWTGLSPLEWPKDVLDKDHPRFPLWQAFRVGIIHEFVNRIKTLRDGVAPGVPIILSAPAYYEASTTLGVNWAHSRFKSSLWYSTERFRSRSLADLVDELALVSRDANPAAIREIMTGVKRATHQERPVGLILIVEQYQNRPGRLLEAIQTLQRGSFGVTVSDAGQIGAMGMWEVLGEAFANPVSPPD
ncbi:MAG: family 10 glycosylhydrolase [Candidatus Eisenbacteria bacterium]|nr:family 10 glycosylhydrolase [Candidatus Eisenbacteria bacterium]